MQDYESEDQQQSQLNDDSFRRLEKRQIEREIIKRLSVRMLILSVLIILSVTLTVWFNSRPKADIDKSSGTINATVSMKKTGGDSPPTTVLGAITSTTLTQAFSQKNTTDTVVFLSLGNMVFNGQVADLIKSKGSNEPFSDIKSTLETGDVIAGSLESPLLSGKQAPIASNITRCGIPEAAGIMKKSGINALSLANDHMMDFGTVGLDNTLNLLDRAGINYAGVGSNAEEAYTHALLDVKGKKVAFLAFSSITPDTALATDEGPGVASSRKRLAFIQNIIKTAASESDYLIVSYHWGDEYDSGIQSYQRKYAKKAIDAGADIVIGNHPHVIQAIELYNGKPIAYSLGDFVVPSGTREYRDALMLKLSLSKGMIIGAEAIPLVIDPSGRPSVATGCAATSILTKLRDLSSPYGTVVDILGDKAQVH